MYQAFIDPNLVRIFGYSSRSQEDVGAYLEVLEMRMKAKHNELPESFLKPLGLKNKDLKDALKLIINSYTGCLRALFNPLCDWKQGISICFTGQLLILQLAYDLSQIPTVELAEANTDAICFYYDDIYEDAINKVLQDWQDLTRLELEGDNIIKYVARDVNNFAQIIQRGDNDYEVHYKGGEFRGQHIFEWDKEKHTFHYSFKNDLENNSLTIVSEAMLKNLLFNIPVEDTINNCNDPLRFQKITHLGSTFEKCILENKDGSVVELQRNNRVYAGIEKTGGMVYKVKPNGSKSKLSDCPPNPIIDNAGEITIDKINKSWYIKYTKQRVSDFVRKGEIYMEDKLETMKKAELIEMIKNNNRSENSTAPINASDKALLLQKISQFRAKIRQRNFIYDKELPKNLGGGEIYSIDQIYQAVQSTSLECGLDFSFETVEMSQFDLKAFVPQTGAPNHIATVKSVITFADIDTGCEKTYTMVSQGSDSIDKAVNSASTMAFRNWFTKNFTPNIINGEEIKYGDDDVNDIVSDEAPSQPKVSTFVPADKKEQIVKEITSEPQKTSNDDDFDEVTDLIMELRELSGNPKAGEKTMSAMLDGSISDIDLMNAKLKLQNTIADLKKK